MGHIAEIIKDFVISILIVICIVIILCIIFYDKIALTKVIPDTEEYTLSDKMQNEIDETNLEGTDEVIINYYIDATDLNKYEKDKEYVKGKSNPFGEVSISDNNTNNSATNSNGSENNDSEGFYGSDGTK